MPRHSQTKLVPYRPDQMFDLVADMEKYPEFLPWCVAAKVRRPAGPEEVADLTIGFGPFRETFTSRVTLERPNRVRVRYERGPFRYLRNEWNFRDDPRGCRVDFFVDFEFRSKLLQVAIGAVFNEAVRRMVDAFLKRAGNTYGPPVIANAAARPPPASEPVNT
jgi:coenzyme Q-binding protein COQ10